MYDYCAACGYESEIQYNSIGFDVVKGNEEFIPVKIHATYEVENDYDTETRNLKIQMCPKCGTLQGYNF